MILESGPEAPRPAAEPVPPHLAAFKQAGAWRERTLPQLALERAMAMPDAPALIGAPPRLAFGALFEQAEAVAASLQELGLRRGDCLSFQVPNWNETAVLNLACAMLGLVVVPIVPIYRDAELRQMLADCRCRALVVTDHFRGFAYGEMIERIRGDLPDLRHVITLRGSAFPLRYDDLLAAGRGRRFEGAGGSPDDVKLLLFTSGTTGRAKGVLHSQNTINAVLDMCIRHWSLKEGEVLLMPSPVTHLTGYGYLEMPFLAGTATLLMESWNAQEAVRLIDEHEVVGTVSATPFLKELTDAAEAAGSRLESLRFFACGGAAVPPDIIRRANRLFAHPAAFRIFGCTEAPLVSMGFLGEGEAELAATTDGRVEDYEVRIVDAEDREVAPGGEGEILVRGPAMMLGYADEEQTREALTSDGFYRTGDLGRLTAERAIVVTGRKKDIIIRGGENISAKEIEDILHRNPDVAEAAVVAMPHPRLGEGICAFVVAAPGAAPDAAALQAYVRASGLALQKIPERILFAPDLPKTATGKVRKDLLRAEAARAAAAG